MMIYIMKKYLFIGLGVLFILFIILANINDDSSNLGKGDVLYMSKTSSATLSDEWGEPMAVALNTELWEDGAYISGDGKTLYYVVYPGEDLIRDVINNDFKGDIDVYYSEYPFVEEKKHSLSEKPWSEGGVMVSGDDIYYHSNKPADKKDKNYDTDIYRNNERLSFNSEEPMDDPHYCALKDELYFWSNNEIYVFRNNLVEKLPLPINEGEENIQPFLTPDCQTMFFSSKRDSDNVKIYKSKRIDEDKWDEPVVVISSKGSVGEPTLTDDGKKIFFIEVTLSDDGKFSSDLYYAEKK